MYVCIYIYILYIYTPHTRVISSKKIRLKQVMCVKQTPKWGPHLVTGGPIYRWDDPDDPSGESRLSMISKWGC